MGTCRKRLRLLIALLRHRIRSERYKRHLREGRYSTRVETGKMCSPPPPLANMWTKSPTIPSVHTLLLSIHQSLERQLSLFLTFSTNGFNINWQAHIRNTYLIRVTESKPSFGVQSRSTLCHRFPKERNSCNEHTVLYDLWHHIRGVAMLDQKLDQKLLGSHLGTANAVHQEDEKSLAKKNNRIPLTCVIFEHWLQLP